MENKWKELLELQQKFKLPDPSAQMQKGSEQDAQRGNTTSPQESLQKRAPDQRDPSTIKEPDQRDQSTIKQPDLLAKS